MTADENKRLVQSAMDELAEGNGQPFVDLLTEDVRWTIIGTTAWSGSWDGKESVRAELLDPLFAQFATRYRSEAIRLIAEADYVVIECRGDATTNAWKRYENTYCYVCRMAGGMVRELTEYCDTELLASALAPPEARAAA